MVSWAWQTCKYCWTYNPMAWYINKNEGSSFLPNSKRLDKQIFFVQYFHLIDDELRCRYFIFRIFSEKIDYFSFLIFENSENIFQIFNSTLLNLLMFPTNYHFAEVFSFFFSEFLQKLIAHLFYFLFRKFARFVLRHF